MWFFGVVAVNISVPPQLAGFVKEQVESGVYHSASEVVRAGLRLLVEQDRQKRLEELRKKIAVGLEQADRGELAPLDVEQIKTEARRRLAEMERADQPGEN